MLQVMRNAGLIVACLVATSMADEESPGYWAFERPTRPTPPQRAALRQAARVRNPIDQFVFHRLEAAGLASAPEAERGMLARRAYFDLLGLPPTPEQVDAFVADTSPRAWQELIDRLLDSKHYGERWGRHWLDVARYADSGGYETDIYYRNAWRYRDYVVKSFNDNMPYDQFVQEQIAGDEIWPDNLDLDPRRVYAVTDEKRKHLQARIATGLFTLGPRVHESGLDAKRLAYETLTDWVDTAASAFLGVTLGCARCHAHKFDPFTQEDYFAMQAIFASAREVEIPLWTSMEEADWRQSYPKVVAVQEARQAYQLFVGSPAGQKDTPGVAQRKQELLGAIGQAVLALPQRAAGQYAVDYVGLMHIPTATVLTREHPELIRPIHVLERGELAKPLVRAEPALPVSLAEATGTSPKLKVPFGGRRQFALWLTRADHPLTARVFVNRVWQWHFGRGIVATPNDFGNMGQPPTHPELLDWLASEFVEDGWNVKNLHRRIMNSAVYRQSSRFAEEVHLKMDPQNELLWRMDRRRLEAEALWDAVHFTAGTLNLAMGGRPVVPPLAADEIASLREKWHWVVSQDPAQHHRRGIYILVRRNFKFPMFEVFDTPVTSVSCPTRDVTTVAPQALWGLNNQSVFDQAVQLAARVVKEAGTETPAQIDRIWKVALGRGPTSEELAAARDLVERLSDKEAAALPEFPEALRSLPPARAHALAKLCLAVFNLSEFAFVD